MDGSTTDTVIFEGDSETGVEEFPQSPVDEEVEFVVPRAASLRARTDDEVTQERGWKLFQMLSRMLLHRPPGGGQISKAKLIQRFQSFVEGHMIRLTDASEQCDEKAAVSRRSPSQGLSDIRLLLSHART